MTKRRLPLNEAAFDVVTAESAYWVGFLMADGNVSVGKSPGRQPRVTLTLASYDRAHVEDFRKFLGSGSKITSGRGLSFTVCSRRIAGALARYGVLPRKTFTAKAIGLERNKDFWRGVVDGDGYIHKEPRHARLALAGSYDLMTQFAAFVAEVTGAPPPNVRPYGNIFTVTITNSRGAKMIAALYGGCTVALARKLERARAVIGEYEARGAAAVSGLKTCSKCREAKPLSAYDRQRTGRGGRTAACRVCTLRRQKAWAERTGWVRAKRTR